MFSIQLFICMCHMQCGLRMLSEQAPQKETGVMFCTDSPPETQFGKLQSCEILLPGYDPAVTAGTAFSGVPALGLHEG